MKLHRKVGEKVANISKVGEWLEPEKLTLLTAWARDGLVDGQIAKNMGISEATLYNYKNKYPEIKEAFRKGKEVVDIEVENALFKKAIGYNTTIRKAFKLKDVVYNENGKKISESERIEYAEEDVHIPADTTAQIFWLKNRKPDKWRDKVIDSENEEAITNATDILVKIRKTVDERYERS
jgi:hypothetical protein